jgi:chromosome segregation ATPase
MTDAYDDLLARAEMAESAMDNLARKLTATEAERDGLREAQAKWLLSPEAAKRLDGYRELGAKCAALEGERDEARNAVQAAHCEVSETYEQRDAARAEARVAKAHVAMLREAIEGLAEAVASDADERRSISGSVGARLTDALAALAATDAEAREFVERVREEARREELKRVKAWFRAELEARGFGTLAGYLDGFSLEAPCIGCDDPTCALCVRRRAIEALAQPAEPKEEP